MKLLDDDIVFTALGHELSLGGSREDYRHHLARARTMHPLTETDRERLLSDLESSALTGHGGAHFPVIRKLRGAMACPTGGTVVANAAEGEPGSAKDAALWQYRPHMIIDGLLTVRDLIGASRLVVWVHEEEHATQLSLEQALGERAAAGHAVSIDILTMPNRYTSGENSSVIAGVRGERIAPRFRLDKARPWGAGEPAILAHNSETLARIAAVRHHGPDAASHHLLTIVGSGRRTVREVHSRDKYRTALPEVSGNPPVLFGGYGASWLPWDTVQHLTCDPAELRASGLGFGAGIIAALPDDRCPIVETGRVLTWMASQSARQCGPCLHGLHDVAERWQGLARSACSAEEFHVLLSRMDLIPGRGGCAHPDGTIRLARSALTLFAEEVDRHIDGGCSHPDARPFLPIPTETT